MTTKNDIAWEKVLNDKPVLETVSTNGFYDIDSKTLKKYREPRLMCKINFRANIPKVFLKNNLSILAIANKQYRIAKTNPFLVLRLPT